MFLSYFQSLKEAFILHHKTDSVNWRYFIRARYGLKCAHQKSHVEGLTPNVTISGDGVLKEKISLSRGPGSKRTGVLLRKVRDARAPPRVSTLSHTHTHTHTHTGTERERAP